MLDSALEHLVKGIVDHPDEVQVVAKNSPTRRGARGARSPRGSRSRDRPCRSHREGSPHADHGPGRRQASARRRGRHRLLTWPPRRRQLPPVAPSCGSDASSRPTGSRAPSRSSCTPTTRLAGSFPAPVLHPAGSHDLRVARKVPRAHRAALVQHARRRVLQGCRGPHGRGEPRQGHPLGRAGCRGAPGRGRRVVRPPASRSRRRSRRRTRRQPSATSITFPRRTS